jgi:hypothetical protein
MRGLNIPLTLPDALKRLSMSSDDRDRGDISVEEFRDYYENHHVPLVLGFAPMPRVYKRNYLIRGDDHNLK